MDSHSWDRLAPFYEGAMRRNNTVYDYLCSHVAKAAAGKEVLELACGPGTVARRVAPATRRMVSTDYSPKMIAQATKHGASENLTFEVADATHLPYPDSSFDVVLIANALHVMPEPELALGEIRRVLRPDGLLICPTYVDHEREKVAFWTRLLEAVGVEFEEKWTESLFLAWLEEHGWHPNFAQMVTGKIPMCYVECPRPSSADMK
jgi:ubiquinone/menaquinone biosynthesis C-methylase UbiE